MQQLIPFLNSKFYGARLTYKGVPFYIHQLPETLNLQFEGPNGWEIIKKIHALNPYSTTRVFQPDLRLTLFAKNWIENSDGSFSKTTAKWKRELREYLVSSNKTLALKIKGATYRFNKKNKIGRRYLQIKPTAAASDWRVIEIAHFLNLNRSTCVVIPSRRFACKLQACGWYSVPDGSYYYKEK